MSLSTNTITECKARLLEIKARLLNQLRDQRSILVDRSFSGDEGDLSALASDENQLFFKNRRLREHLIEVESALSRIEQGMYGVCEETQEVIEENRLLALPWTRLSIEGASIREAQKARHTS